MLGSGRDVGSTAVPYSTRGLTLRFVLLTGMAIGLVGVSALIQELQAASTAWIMGQSHWSRGQQQATHALSRYIASGEPRDLAAARQGLTVPLGDLGARRALEQASPDIAAARRGFIAGGNAPGDINRLILSYRYLREQPYFRDAVTLWRDTDDDLMELVAIAGRVQAGHAAGSLTPAVKEGLLAQVQALDTGMQNQARAFSGALLDTAAAVRIATFIVGGLSVLAITLVAVLLARRVRNDLTEQESRFRAAFYQATVGMLKLDEEGGIVEANQAMADILDHRREALLSLSLVDVLVEGELVLDEHGRIDWPRQLRPGELRFLRADGSLMWGRWSGTVVRTRARAPTVFALVEDVSQNHALAREVEHHASHDPLTGLINRREIERLLEQALVTVRAEGGTHALCYIDLDYFKLVNDGLGHAAGDQLLRSFADYLVGAVRDGDWVGRLGGDEFALFLANASQDEAKQVLQRVIRTLGQVSFQHGEGAPKVSCSIGVVEVTAEAPDVNWLMSAADSACYAAKEAGRNRVHCYNESRMALDERRREAERLANVSSAIAENRMLLYAQRIERVGDPDFLHYEVLVRMRSPEGVLQGPGEFMGAVERYGMGMALDRHVLSLLFRHLQVCPAHVQQLGLCNVNVSAQSIAEPSFLAFVTDLLERNRGLARKLCFEITETAAVSNIDQARTFIDAVKARGCRMALDDFGSGLSSFGYLRQLPADMLKIDGVFVRDMNLDPVNRAAVRAITEVGRELHMMVVAEWVESAVVADQLAQMGVEGLQGYAIERPIPLERMTQPALRAARAGVSSDAWRGTP
ncbi:diguanylate cyclase/phosphodiesterase with PAS/PAC sensor(s) [Stenotrophomonas rhizophila]|uniref:putative bifunctional diguanylate cyclase/phosphodiesterase n=1 Tax=Stenotrophomonas rhizophila TaxID=216778 RepID=UPI000F4C427B|nr:EAL domain-containing protein [Stenotrophomonas rhizophila]ROP79555.1 diguanylate cyclase/phosphodiesterase with PAS/PAC sensor(s) [Stenotrophomonas rhizophila]